MLVCERIRVTRKKICTGDMNARIDLVTREIEPPPYGSADTTTVFTSILKPWAAIDTLGTGTSYARRFDGINIEDRPTHAIYINYDPAIWPIDSDNVFVLLEDDRRLRIVGAKDINEQRLTIELLCTERGVEKGASEA